VFTLLWVSGLVAGMRNAILATRRLQRFHVDGVTGELRVQDKGFFGLIGRQVKVPKSRLARFVIGIAPDRAPEVSTSLEVEHGPVVRVAWWVAEAGRRPERAAGEVTFRVLHMDKREEVLDLALRIAAAAGFASYRVLRSDTRELEVEMDRQSIGDQPMPDLRRADYQKDDVAAEARSAAAAEKVAPFEPAAFRSDYRVREWKPGERVVFHRPFSWGLLGCLPFAIAPVALQVVLALGYGTVTGSAAILHVFLGVFSLLGVVMFGVALAGTWPRRASIDWSTRRIHAGREPAIPLSAVTAVELRGVKAHHKPSKGASYWTYHCEIDVHHAGADGATTTRLVETSSTRDDGVEPWRCALPLVSELARALGVERRVTDFSERSVSSPSSAARS
jgi:hypothetical protein